ncbi:MAG TPA: hypothetical protein VFI97_04645 [Arthrobacter sp.]|nr:hypothetical protein [Arthrobacter sp.]
MSDSVLKTWQRACGVFGDLCRAAALVAAMLAGLIWSPAFIAAFVIVFAVLLVPRITLMPRPFDAAFSFTVLVSAITGAAGWYESVPWWDIVAHVVTTGAAAAMIYLVLARYEVVHNLLDHGPSHHRPRIILLTAAFGLSAGVFWEFLEWIVYAFDPKAVGVGYVDTVGDLAADTAGSLIAGVFLVAWAHAGGGTHRPDAAERKPATDTGSEPVA